MEVVKKTDGEERGKKGGERRKEKGHEDGVRRGAAGGDKEDRKSAVGGDAWDERGDVGMETEVKRVERMERPFSRQGGERKERERLQRRER